MKREFFRYRLGYAIELRSAYSLRLYQWAKRWQFTGKRLITVEELRTVIGAEELDEKGNVKKKILPKFGELHKWALRPAVKTVRPPVRRFCVSVTLGPHPAAPHGNDKAEWINCVLAVCDFAHGTNPHSRLYRFKFDIPGSPP